MSRYSDRLLFVVCLLIVMAMPASGLTSNVFWTGDPAENVARWKAGTYCPVREFNRFVNSIFLPDYVGIYLEEKLGENPGYYLTTYLRDVIGGSLIYWIFAAIWHLFCYVVWVKDFFLNEKRPLPSTAIILDSMIIAQAAVFIYAILPVFAGFLIENKLTLTYFYIHEEIGGWGLYFALLVVYMFFVEIGVYWVHRTEHTNKWLYKHLHSVHHKYNSAVTLTPWASIAFHPLDGIAQASPYVVLLFFIPCHYYTHIFLVFFTAVWATNIHDSLWGNFEPIMGSKYHLMHHTHYHYNYGQYLTMCDWYWGTLRVPDRSLLNPQRTSSKVASLLETFGNDTDNTKDEKLLAEAKKK